jgi:methylase of polypeptide subunit release factors
MLHRCLFGYNPCNSGDVYGEYWDWTTLILRKALQQYLSSDISFLDMGTGPVGVLAIFAKLRLGCKKVHAADHIPEIVCSAKRNADFLKLDIEFYCGDLFANINDRFDVICFNATYLDLELGHKSEMLRDKLSELRFSGGQGGGKTIGRFLRDAPEYLTDNGLVILGVNHYHIPKSTVRDLLSSSRLELRECVESFVTPASAYVLCQHHG